MRAALVAADGEEATTAPAQKDRHVVPHDSKIANFRPAHVRAIGERVNRAERSHVSMTRHIEPGVYSRRAPRAGMGREIPAPDKPLGDASESTRADRDIMQDGDDRAK
jgi:hypothetical protein